MMRILLGFSILLMGTGFGHATSHCNVPSIRLLRDVPATGYMYVKAGKNCSIQSTNSPGGNTGIEISRRPSNGKLEVNGLKIVYTPRAGFVGKDSFGYVRRALDPRTNTPVTLPVNVEVTVQP